jgi:hypothetical protein
MISAAGFDVEFGTSFFALMALFTLYQTLA